MDEVGFFKDSTPASCTPGGYACQGPLLQRCDGAGTAFDVLAACPNSWALNWHGHLIGLSMYVVYFYLFYQLMVAKMAAGKKSKEKKK